MTAPVLLKLKNTVRFLDLACQVIDQLEQAYGPEIPDFKEELAVQMATRYTPWRGMPVMGTTKDPITGKLSGRNIWALIREAYAAHQPGYVLLHLMEKGQSLSTWKITDTWAEIHPVLYLEVDNALSRHRNNMASLSYLTVGNGPLTAALTSNQLWNDLRKLIEVTKDITGNIATMTATDLAALYGWLDANDAINYLEVSTSVRGQASRDVGNACWLEYDRKVP